MIAIIITIQDSNLLYLIKNLLFAALPFIRYSNLHFEMQSNYQHFMYYFLTYNVGYRESKVIVTPNFSVSFEPRKQRIKKMYEVKKVSVATSSSTQRNYCMQKKL